MQRLTRLRREYTVLRQSRFLTAEWNEGLGVKDLTWLTPSSEEMTPDHWHDPQAKCIGMLLDGRVQVSGIPRRGSEATLLLVVNAHYDIVVFKLPEVAGGRDWLRLVDTNLPDEGDELEEAVRFAFGDEYDVTARSLLLFLLRPERRRRQS